MEIKLQLLIIFVNLIINSVNANRGPIGYDLFRNIDRISELRTGVHTRQFSSFDRRGGNGDGGGFDCLRKTADGHCVIAEWLGAGEVDSIWTTRDNGVFNRTGYLLIELDNEPIIHYKLQNIVDGVVGIPFVWPLVGDGEDTAGGGVIKIPMTFRSSMRITTDVDPIYYHVTYRTFADSKDVRTFDVTDPALDVIDQLRHFGVRDPKTIKDNKETVSVINSTVSKGSKKIIFEQNNTSAEIREISLHLPHLVRSPRVVDDGRAFGEQGWTAFVCSVSSKNKGVRITRKMDPSVHKQIAQIFIDGVSSQKWNSTSITANGVWAEETVYIDANLTTNKSRINVKNVFISSAYDFNEFRYDIDSLVDGQWVRSDVIEVGPNHPGEEKAHYYEIYKQSWEGDRVFRYSADQRVVNMSDHILANCRIQATFDGHLTVDAPIGQFFGSGLGMYDTRTLWFSIDALNGVFTTWWSMPFANEARIEIVNSANNSFDLNDLTSKVTFVRDNSIRTNLSSGQIGYFHATHNQHITVPGHDYIFLNTSGHGIVYGVTHTMFGLIETGNIADYLEGDERIYIDGQKSPHIYGTGTEDFYESGWYFRGGTTYDMPMAGSPAHEIREDDCENECFGAIRLFAGGLSFESQIVFGIEHGPINDEQGLYASVTYWYGQTNSVLKQTDSIDALNNESRQLHGYKAVGEKSYQLNSSYEGENYEKMEIANVTTANGEISFTIKIDSKNTGVRIFRTGDQSVSYQSANVLIDNQSIGTWLQPLGNAFSRWLDDNFDIPSSVSGQRDQLNVKLVPMSYNGGQTLWSASHYTIYSIVSQ